MFFLNEELLSSSLQIREGPQINKMLPNMLYTQRRSSRPPNPPNWGGPDQLWGPSLSEIAFWLRDYFHFSRLVYNRFKL